MDKPEVFFFDSGVKLSAADIAERKRRTEQERAKAEKELAEDRAKAAALAVELWKQSSLVVDHPYLGRKQVSATPTIKMMTANAVEKIIGYKPKAKGEPLTGNILIIPIGGDNGLSSIEMIDENGKKSALYGGLKKACYWMTGKAPDGADLFVIGEGVATVLSGSLAIGCVGVAALSCHNLKAVALIIRHKYPAAKIIILSDIGIGEDAAQAAALAVNGYLVKPIFSPGSTGTDANDLHVESGIEELKRQIVAALDVAPIPADDDWPEPLLFGEIETPDIPSTLLPKILADQCQAVADSSQTPTGMAVMMGLATVATCLQKRFEVAPFGDSYTEPVNLMTVTALDSASRKSAVVKAMTGPLTSWEMTQMDLLKDRAGRIRHERDMLIKSIDSIKSSASKSSATDDDRREALTEIKRLEDMTPPEIIVPRAWIDDVTPERLQSLMFDNGERMAVISAEGGIFEVIAGLYSGGKSNINVILQSHAGEPVRVERQGRSVMMLKPALTFGLCVQPTIISDLASGNKARFRGNGMLARLLYCIPKSTVGSRNVAKHRPVPETTSTGYDALTKRLLLAISPIYDEHGQERPRILTLAPDALKAWLTFSQYIESKQGQYGEFQSIQDWTGKLPGAALRIAGLCHVAEHGEASAVISRHIIEKALDLSELLIIHAKAAFALMGTDPAIPDAKFILQWIVSNGADSFRRGDLHKALHGKFQRVDRLISALKVLAERHIISEPLNKPTGRRPEIVYTVNPAILKGGN